MANVVEHVLQITSGKSQKNISIIVKELKTTQKELDGIGKDSAKNFNKMAKASANAQKSLSLIRKSLTGLVAGVGTAAAAFVGFNKILADNMNQIVDSSARSGIATKTLAGLRLAVEGSGKSFSTLERGLDQFNVKLLDSNRASSESSKIFKALGISVVDNVTGSLRPANDVFEETIDALSRVEDQTSKAAIAQKLFGRSGGALLQSGAIEDMEKYIGLAEEFGPAFDDNAIKKAAEFQRGMALLKTSAMGALQSILFGITGENSIGEAFKRLATDVKIFGRNAVTFFKGLKMSIDSLLDSAMVASDTFAFISGDLQKIGRNNRVERSTLGQAFQTLGPVPQTGEAKERQSIEFLARNAPDILSLSQKRNQLQADRLKLAGKELESLKQSLAVLEFLTSRKLSPTEIQEMINTRVIERKEIEKSKLELQKLRKEQENRKPIKFDLSVFENVKTKAGEAKEEVKQFFDFIEQKEDPFGLNELGTDDPLDVIEKIEEQEKATKKAIKALEEMKKSILDIGKVSEPFADIENQLFELKNKFIDLGMSSSEIDILILEIEKLRSELEKTSKTQFKISLSTDIVNLASGDVLGSMQSVFSKFLSEAQMKTANLAIGGVSALASFGGELAQAGQTAVDDEERKREDRFIANMERSFGRSLSDAEKERVRNTINLSEKEQEKLREQAMKERAAERVENFILAIKTGIQMLPAVLFEVLPPLFVQLAQDIVQALIELPFRIVKGIVEGIKNLFSMVVEGPKRIFENLGTFFGNLFDGKRTGGRILSARRGLRFTGSQEQSLAMLHRNEYVVPQSGARPQAVERIMNQQSGGGMTININADVVDRDAVETLVRKIEQRFQSFGQYQSTLFAG